MSSSRFRIWARIETSSADTGSSQITSSGSRISARAMQMRWHWPPENSCGRRPVTRSASRPTAVKTSRTRRSRSALSVTPMMISGSATMSPMQRLGLSEAIGSWKISCRRRRIRRIFSAVEPGELGAVEHHLARGRAAQLQDGAAQGRLATARIRPPGPRSRPCRHRRLTSDTADSVLPPTAYSTTRFSTESSARHSGCQQAKRPPNRSGSASGGLASRQRSSA